MPAPNGHPDPHRHPEFYHDVPPKRLIAWGIDMLITAVLAAPLILPTVAVSFLLIFPVLLVPLIWVLVGFAYRWATITVLSGTLGMRFMGIELRDHTGGRLSSTTAFLHTLASMLAFGMPFIQTASVALMAFSTRGQGLPDLVLGTVMLNRAA